VKIGGVNVEYIIYFPERIEIGPLFPVIGKRDFSSSSGKGKFVQN
jgi:hypothetical protein